jgi:hypothetical protein
MILVLKLVSIYVQYHIVPHEMKIKYVEKHLLGIINHI